MQIKQAEAIEALARRGVNGIAVSCSEANTAHARDRQGGRRRHSGDVFRFRCARTASDSPTTARTTSVCGKAVMGELAKSMGDKGTIAILAGNQSAPNLQTHVAGVREELKNHPNIHELNNGAGVFYHQETPEKAAEAVAMRRTPTRRSRAGRWSAAGRCSRAMR